MIRRYSLLDVVTNDKVLYNTNNHYLVQPHDYTEKVALGNTKNWVDKFHTGYTVITLDSADLAWMKPAFQLCSQTRRFSRLYDSELEMTCAKYTFPEGRWFIRSERVSLKSGCHGCGPYTSMQMVIESMVTCIRGHQCFRDLDSECKLYLLQWLDLDPEKEFRIFVYNNQITAFSIQNIYSVNEWLNGLTDTEILKVLSDIQAFFIENVKDKMVYMSSYTMDLAVLPENKFYFIEPNSFGKEYSAGSALYHWIHDTETLLSDKPTVQLRYTAEQ